MEQFVAPGHRLPDEDWAAVVRRAAQVRQEVTESAAGGASGPGGIIVDMTARCLASKKYFGVSGIPTQLLVLHSAECPLQAGFAVSLTEWFSATVHPAPPTASWQRFVDPIHRVRAVPDDLGAWHASEANPLSIGWEQAGYARYTRAEWLTPDGRQQLELLALDWAEVAVRDGIPPVWLTTDQVNAITSGRDRTTKGFCTHRQIDPDTRTDPGNGYPFDLLTERIVFHMGGTTTPEEDMFDKEAKTQLEMTLDDAHRARGVLDSIEEPLHKKLLRINRWVKSKNSDSIYELADGKLRGITAVEWKLLGRPEPTIVDQADIDAMPKVG